MVFEISDDILDAEVAVLDGEITILAPRLIWKVKVVTESLKGGNNESSPIRSREHR